MNEIYRRPKKIKYSQIGKSCNDDFIKFIYEDFFEEKYKIFNLDEDEIKNLLKFRNFKSMNVFYPYNSKIPQYLDDLTNQAIEIKDVNLIQGHKENLYGFNTEFFGINKMIMKSNINLKDKNILILKNFQSINTLIYVLNSMQIKSYEILERDDIKNMQNRDFDIIFNYIDFTEKEIEELNLEAFSNLEHIYDFYCENLFSKINLQAMRLDISVSSGLYKILYQEKKSIELLTRKRYSDELFENILKKYLNKNLNIVLIGMPGSGKTTIGRKLAKLLDKEHIDLDEEFYYEYGISPSQYLRFESEEEFRKKEARIVERIGNLKNTVISTSGGVVQLLENYNHLKKNSIIVRVDRKLKYLSTRNRPLSKGGIETLIKMEKDRREKYKYFTDYVVENKGDFDKPAEMIKKIFKNHIKYGV